MSRSSTELVLSFFDLMNSGDPARMEQAVDLLTDDATYWIPGDWPNAGTFTKAQVAEMVKGGTEMFDGPLDIAIHGVTTEGGRVAVEMGKQWPVQGWPAL